MNRSMAEKLVRKEIEVKRDFVAKAPMLCDIVQKFDGKVFNKRLETALKEIMYIDCKNDKVMGWFEMTGYIQDRCVMSDEVDKWGGRDCAYIKDDRIYMVSCAKDCLTEDGRIIAENICKRIYDEMARQKTAADKLEEQLARIDEIEAQCKQINELKRKFDHDTLYQIRTYFGLEV